MTHAEGPPSRGRRRVIGVLGSGALLGIGGGWLVTQRAEGRAAAAEAAYPPEGRVVEVWGRRVHAVTKGAGPDLVLVHGALGSCRDMTFGFVDRLAARYRVTAFDRPGMGYSDVPDPQTGLDPDTPAAQAALLRAAAPEFGIERSIVVGHSFGASVAVAWALADPEGTAALVEMAGLLLPWEGPNNLLFRVNGSALGGAVVAPLLAALAPEAAVASVLGSIFAPNPVPEGYAEHIGSALSLRSEVQRINARQVLALRPALEEMRQAYPSLAMPVEIVQGTADEITAGLTQAEGFAALVPGAGLTVLEGVGHMPHHADPEAVIAAIDRARSRAGL
jgi:pimeloyl-ACP methyl ester carboxylesterase